LVALVIRLLTEITDILGRSFPAISGYWNDYRKHGLQGLEFNTRPPRPKKLTDQQEKQLRQVVAKKRPLQYNWFPKGQQRKIPTYGQHSLYIF
jgi:transposase